MATTGQRASPERTSSTGGQRGRRTQSAAAKSSTASRSATLEAPGVRAEVQPDKLPGAGYVRSAVGTVREYLPSQENLPSREQAVFYGGLGALAIFSVIEWPVAVAIGAGTLVSQRATSGARPRQTRASSTR
jgi:hypothetical protein